MTYFFWNQFAFNKIILDKRRFIYKALYNVEQSFHKDHHYNNIVKFVIQLIIRNHRSQSFNLLSIASILLCHLSVSFNKTVRTFPCLVILFFSIISLLSISVVSPSNNIEDTGIKFQKTRSVHVKKTTGE